MSHMLGPSSCSDGSALSFPHHFFYSLPLLRLQEGSQTAQCPCKAVLGAGSPFQRRSEAGRRRAPSPPPAPQGSQCTP